MKNKKTFKCEICGEKTPIECEGANPNTCAMCCPTYMSWEQLIHVKHVKNNPDGWEIKNGRDEYGI